MELHLALKNIVNLSGTSILKEQRLVNILADFNAYDDVPSAKFIIKTIIDEGYMEKLLANGKWDLNCEKLIDQFVAMTSMVKDNVAYVFESIGISMGWNTTLHIATRYNNAIKAQSTKNVTIGEGLNNIVDVINSNEGMCKLKLKNPTAVNSSKGKILVSCEVYGATDVYFNIYCSVYAKGAIIQTIKLASSSPWEFTGFTIVSSEFKLKCDVQDISKIVIYFGS